MIYVLQFEIITSYSKPHCCYPIIIPLLYDVYCNFMSVSNCQTIIEVYSTHMFIVIMILCFIT